jgi:hypothetical protein
MNKKNMIVKRLGDGVCVEVPVNGKNVVVYQSPSKLPSTCAICVAHKSMAAWRTYESALRENPKNGLSRSAARASSGK